MSQTSYRRTIGEKLREARLRLKLTQSQAAEKIGVGQVYLSDVEIGKRSPTLDWIHAAARSLDIDPHDLDARLASTRHRR